MARHKVKNAVLLDAAPQPKQQIGTPPNNSDLLWYARILPFQAA
ncbi:hypothetical protein [Stenoxybacter acetivorans]|nr:hypothetical protein [Stenoxybacter acetivorans]